jgi:hypothetical protein
VICALIRSCNAAPATAAACAALLLADQALAQPAPTPTGANANRTVNLNYVYAAQLGFGGYSLAGLSADVYTLPLADTLQNLPYEGWALKLLLPVQVSTASGPPMLVASASPSTSNRCRSFRALNCRSRSASGS